MGRNEKTKVFVIVNPQSAGGLTMRRWPRASEKLEKAVGKFDYEFTNAQGVATLLAKEAVEKGFKKIISVGGDGTLNEVVQGLFDKNGMINPDIVVGMLPFGSGADLCRTLEIPLNEDAAIERLKGDEFKRIDIGKAEFKDHQGKKRVRYFVNMADVGFGGDVVERVNSTQKILGGFATYLFSSVITFARFKSKKVKIKIDDAEFIQPITSVIVTNGKYCGGGMWIAPPAEIDDGILDVIIVGELTKRSLVSFLPRLYSGKLITAPGVRHLQAKNISVESDDDVLINIDGEQPGTTPVRFTILPVALKFKV